MKTNLERSTGRVTLTFLNEEGNTTTPISARYRIDCLTSGQVIREWTDLTALSPSMTITLTEEDNRIIASTNPEETRELVLDYASATGNKLKGVARWTVQNLRGVV